MNMSAWPRNDEPIDFSRTSAFTRHSSDSHSTSSSNGSNSPAGGTKSLVPSPRSPVSPASPATSTPSLNSSASRKKGRPLPEELKDDAYWERRRKNNEAAKRSRDARRAKEYEVAIRATILEQENLKLRVEIASLNAEVARLKCLMHPSMKSCFKSSRDSCCVHEHD